MEYADEPPLIFAPLSEEDYCLFYALEMDGYREDAPFYISRLQKRDALLELGCGSGRLTALLSGACRAITAVDISAEMLRLAKLRHLANVSYHRQDMAEFRIDHQFDAIIIPYNTLNLLGSAGAVRACLHRCRNHLTAGGRLLLHLYHPDEKILTSQGRRFFQFVIHDLADGGRLIKETLKSYDARSQLLTLEERYRHRPQSPDEANRDLRHILTLFAPQLSCWHSLLREAGFAGTACYSDFDDTPFRVDATTLLVEARP